jgi:hypothetical protein
MVDNIPEPEILSPKTPQEHSLHLGQWIIPISPETLRVTIKTGVVVGLLGWAATSFK